MAIGWTGVSERDPLQFGFDAKHPWRFACGEANCYFCVCADSEADALAKQKNHRCPLWGGETKVSWNPVTRTLVQQMWDLLDQEIEGAVHDVPGTKIRARAIAECLAIFMPPFFTTADEIAREAGKRYKAKQAGEEYETPGIGARRYETATVSKYMPRPAAAAPAATSKLKDGEIAAIKFALESGMFTKADLAKTYKVPLSVIETVSGA